MENTWAFWRHEEFLVVVLLKPVPLLAPEHPALPEAVAVEGSVVNLGDALGWACQR